MLAVFSFDHNIGSGDPPCTCISIFKANRIICAVQRYLTILNFYFGCRSPFSVLYEVNCDIRRHSAFNADVPLQIKLIFHSDTGPHLP